MAADGAKPVLAVDSVAALDQLAVWSPWVPFHEATGAPIEPGVYRVRERPTGRLIYIGMAGERHGRGLRGRLSVYLSGKAFTSGLGEAVGDRALADPLWLRERLAEVEAGQPRRAKAWGRAALERADLEVSWSTTADGRSASSLEERCLHQLAATSLWNRRRRQISPG